MRYFWQAWARIFSPETLIPFLLGAVCLSVLGNAVTQLLSNWLGTTTWAAIQIVMGTGLVLCLAAAALALALARQRPAPVDLGKEPPRSRRGLILLISKPEVPRKAMKHHIPMLEHCWMICSRESHAVAEKLQVEFADQIKKFELVFVNDVNDPLDYWEQVNRIYANLPKGWHADDVIADYTGMTAHGSVGMALACVSPRRPLQYTPAVYNKELQALEPLDPFEVLRNPSRVSMTAKGEN